MTMKPSLSIQIPTPPRLREHQRLHRRPLSRILQGLFLIYVMAAVSVFVVQYDVTMLETVEFAHRTMQEGEIPPHIHAPWPKVVFVHVGKTGGTTVGSMLRVLCDARTKADSRQYSLDQWKSKQQQLPASEEETRLSKYTKGFVHVTGIHPHESILEEATHFLVTLRNPMDRVVSWFYFLHPQNCYEDASGQATPRDKFSLIDKACITKRLAAKSAASLENKFYHDCFPTASDFALALSKPQNDNHNDCHELAHQTLHGRGGPNGFAGHLWANYTYYAQKTLQKHPHSTILGVRTDHLWGDLATIEGRLGGTPRVFRVQQDQSTPSTQQYHKDKLSPEAYFSLCCALQDELKVYQEFVTAAINLDTSETLEPIFQQCRPNIQSLSGLKLACQDNFNEQA